MTTETDTDLPPRLRVDGARLLKPNGQEFVPRGLNFGSWGEDDPVDATPVAAMGANIVRVCLRWWGKHGDPTVDSRDNDAFAFLRRTHFERWLALIAAVAAEGMWVVPFIDSNCGQSGTQDAGTMAYCDPYQSWGARGRNFFTDPAMRRVFSQVVWPAASARLRTVAKIAFLELLPEPAGKRGPEYAAPVREFYRECIAAIRQPHIDMDTPFLIGARDGYAIELCEEAFLEERSDVVYTGNLLNPYVSNPSRFDDGLAALLHLRDTRGVPVFVQQLGRKTNYDPDRHLMRRALQAMEDTGTGYCWWQWKQNTDNEDDYGLNYKNQTGTGWVQKTDEMAVLEEAWSA
jgi:hypothetical protein